MAQDKRVSWDADQILSRDNTVYGTHFLTERDIVFFASVATACQWRTRWSNVASGGQFDTIQAYAAGALERLFTTVDFCTEVAWCIDNSPAVQGALTRFIDSNYYGEIGQPVNDGTAPLNSPDYNPTCDKDILWAQCYQLVDRTYNGLQDFFLEAEVASNAVELFDALANSIPVIAAAYDAIGADGWVDLVEYAQTSAIEQFDAAADTAYREGLACDIFCACQDDCEITPDRLFGVMVDRTQGYITDPVATFLDVISTVAGLGINTSIVADAAFWFSFGSLKLGSILMPDTVGYAIDLIFRLAVNDANNDWILLCACSQSWVREYDFTVSDHGWTVTPNSGGVYVSGTGWQSQGGTYLNALRQIADIQLPFSGYDITSIEVVYDLTVGTIAVQGRVLSSGDGARNYIKTLRQDQGSGTDIVATWSGTETTQGNLRCYAQAALGGTNGSATIKKITIEGTGTPPP